MNKKLTKSTKNVVLTGTLGGVAEFLGIDATIIRVVYVFFSVVSAAFPGILLYIVLALIVPSGRGTNSGTNPYYQNTTQKTNRDFKQFKSQTQRKEAEKIEDDDWSDF